MTVIEPSGPTEHLQTVDYWKGLYLDTVKYGQELIDAIRQHHRDIRGLGVDSQGRWGGSYDHKLWAVLGLPTGPDQRSGRAT
jgi:hypothetical protein